MKKLFLLLTLLFLLVACNAQGVISVTPASYDFGEIDQNGGIVQASFIVQNKGRAALKINRISTSCSCTTAEMDMSDLAPGESRELKVGFDPLFHSDALGPITRVVYLQSSDPANPELEIDLTGTVMKQDKKFLTSINPEQLIHSLEDDAEYFLLDVHIPEQEHIEGTDAFIPYNEIEARVAELPQDKDLPILVYCRSGNMSKTAAEDLIKLGYTNVIDLTGGKNAYDIYTRNHDLTPHTYE